jgi:glucose-6-phosphate 1-dehydrogenase
MSALARRKAAATAGAPPAPDCVMVIFGAGGDLAKRLLVPALYNLMNQGLLGEGFNVLGVDHNASDDAHFRAGVGQFLAGLAGSPDSEFGDATIDASAWKRLSTRLFYQVGDFEDDASFKALAQRLAQMGGEGGPSILFYLAVAPRFFGDIIDRLARAGLTEERNGRFRRVVIEKPFGADLASARALNRRILKSLDEGQIYRIDHFLGKETVRNLMVARFANGVFEPLWNRDHIDHVQITAAETVGVEDRGGYYDQTGALRDMVPNHLFQLLAMTAMEAPNALDAAAVSAERTRVIEAVQIPSPAEALADAVRGQYRPGEIEGRSVVDYRREPHVAARSRTETFVALKLGIDNWRWAGVPFYLRTGKAMSARDTEVAIRFKGAPGALFKTAGGGCPRANTLVLQIQPDEGMSLQFEAKRPGPDVVLAPVRMDFRYADAFAQRPSTGYETLIYDCLIGDRTLFKSADEIELGWRAVQPFLDAWTHAGRVHGYAAGSDGPPQARALLERDGRSWRPVAA